MCYTFSLPETTALEVLVWEIFKKKLDHTSRGKVCFYTAIKIALFGYIFNFSFSKNTHVFQFFELQS